MTQRYLHNSSCECGGGGEDGDAPRARWAPRCYGRSFAAGCDGRRSGVEWAALQAHPLQPLGLCLGGSRASQQYTLSAFLILSGFITARLLQKPVAAEWLERRGGSKEVRSPSVDRPERLESSTAF